MGATARSLHKRTASIGSEMKSDRRLGFAYGVPAPVVVRGGVDEAEVVGIHGHGDGSGLGRRGEELGGTTGQGGVAAELEGKGEGGDRSAGGGGRRRGGLLFVGLPLVACRTGRTDGRGRFVLRLCECDPRGRFLLCVRRYNRKQPGPSRKSAKATGASRGKNLTRAIFAPAWPMNGFNQLVFTGFANENTGPFGSWELFLELFIGGIGCFL
jgi:hypothetical protein